MSDKVPVDYWVAGATTLPILALALIVETRSLASKTENAPLPIQAIQYITWAVLLLLAGILELVCFSAIRGGAVSRFWAATLEATVSGFLGSLVFLPALTLLSTGVGASWVAGRYAAVKGRLAILQYRVERLRRRKANLNSQKDFLLNRTEELTELARAEQARLIEEILALDPEVHYTKIHQLYVSYHDFESVIQSGKDILKHHHSTANEKVAADDDQSTVVETSNGQYSADYRLFEDSGSASR